MQNKEFEKIVELLPEEFKELSKRAILVGLDSSIAYILDNLDTVDFGRLSFITRRIIKSVLQELRDRIKG